MRLFPTRISIPREHRVLLSFSERLRLGQSKGQENRERTNDLQTPLDWGRVHQIIIIHLLGLAPAGFSTAPHNGPWAMAEVVHVGTPLRRSG
jgi:hypothetical protein